MKNEKYYIFKDQTRDNILGFQHSEIWKLPDIDASWISGFPHQIEIPTPVIVELNPEFGTELLDAYHEFIVIWSNRLIEAFHKAGVDNMDLYDAKIVDLRSGLETSDYKAVNIIGLVDASDMEKSEYDPASERLVREFKKLVIDSKKTMGLKMFRLLERPTIILINDQVRKSLDAANLKGIQITAALLS